MESSKNPSRVSSVWLCSPFGCLQSMSADDHDFLFSPLNPKPPNSARKVHIRRLYDVFQLCLHRNDFPRARRAWTILARCKEVDWKMMWTTGVLLLGENSGTQPNEKSVEFLSTMLRQYPDEVSSSRMSSFHAVLPNSKARKHPTRTRIAAHTFRDVSKSTR